MRHLLNLRPLLQRKIRVADNQGGWTESWTDVGNISARLRPATASEREVAAQEQAHIDYVVYCPAEAGVARGHRMLLGNLALEITAVRRPSQSAKHIEAEAVMVQRG